MGAFIQKIERAGPYRLKLELMPLTVKPEKIPWLTLLILSLFANLGAFFLLGAFLPDLDRFQLAAGTNFAAIVLYAFFHRSFCLTIDQQMVSMKTSAVFFLPADSWQQQLSAYHYVAGRRYYGFFYGTDTPQLVREVVLIHSQNRSYDVVLARDIDDSVDNTDRAIAWQSEWHKACTILGKKALRIVDTGRVEIDLAQIALAFGDGGAQKPEKG